MKKPISHADGSTRRPSTPALEGGIPLPEEITGRASGTTEDLVALFDNETDAHVRDGFRGGSADIPDQGVAPDDAADTRRDDDDVGN